MAKKAKKSVVKTEGGRVNRDAAAERAAPAKAPPPVEVDLLKLDDELENTLNGYLGYDSPFAKQKMLISKLEQQLADERAKLEMMAAPLRAAAAALSSERIKAAIEAQPYDEAIKRIVGPITLAYKWRNDGNGTTKNKSTGAKPWKELRETGATGEQIIKNIESLVAGTYSTSKEGGGYRLRCEASGGKHYLERIDAGSFGGGRTVLSTTAEVVAAIRRVMEIPQPIAAAKKPAKKSAGKKAPKSKRGPVNRDAAAERGSTPRAKPKSSPPRREGTKTHQAKAPTNGKAAAKSIANGKAKPSPRTGLAINDKEFPLLTRRGVLRWSADGYRVHEPELAAKLTPEETKAWNKRRQADYPRDELGLSAGPVEEFLEGEAQFAGQAATNGKHTPTNRIAGFDAAFTDKSKPAVTSSPPELAGVTAGAMPRREAASGGTPPSKPSGDADQDRADALARCKPMEAALLEVIFAAGPGKIKRKAQITTEAGYQPGGKVSAAFKRLAADGYIVEVGRSLVKSSAAYFAAEKKSVAGSR